MMPLFARTPGPVDCTLLSYERDGLCADLWSSTVSFLRHHCSDPRPRGERSTGHLVYRYPGQGRGHEPAPTRPEPVVSTALTPVVSLPDHAQDEDLCSNSLVAELTELSFV